MNKLLFCSIILSILLAGCSQGISGSALNASNGFSSKKLSDLINDPSVQVTETSLVGSAISASLNGAAAGCVGLVADKQYLLVEASSPTTNYSVVLDGGAVQCVVRKEKLVDQCQSDADCEDGLSSTVDSCSGKPKACSNLRTTECKSGDSFCPSGCVKNASSTNNDDDCLRECTSVQDCEDSDPTTKDSCGGILSICIHEKIFVGGKVVVACSADQECLAENVCSSGACEEGVCVFNEKPNGTVCDSKSDLECYNGDCVSPTDNLVRLTKTEIRWENDGSSVGKIIVNGFTNKLSTFEVRYGTSPSLNSIEADVYCPLPDTCNSVVAIEHEVTLTNLNLNSKYYYQMTAKGTSGLTVSQTKVQEFFTCPSKCGEPSKCDIKIGRCV